MVSTWYVFSFRMVFFYLVSTGWILDIGLCENLINQNVAIQAVVAKDLPISPRFTPYDFLSRCKFGTLTTRELMVGFYLLTFSGFPLRTPE